MGPTFGAGRAGPQQRPTGTPFTNEHCPSLM